MIFWYDSGARPGSTRSLPLIVHCHFAMPHALAIVPNICLFLVGKPDCPLRVKLCDMQLKPACGNIRSVFRNWCSAGTQNVSASLRYFKNGIESPEQKADSLKDSKPSGLLMFMREEKSSRRRVF